MVVPQGPGENLARAGGALDKVGILVERVAEHISSAQQRLRREGFPGIAQNMAAIAVDNGTTASMVTTAIDGIRRMHEAADAVSDQETPDRALVALTAIAAGIEHEHNTALAIGAQIHKTDQTTRRVLHRGSPGELLRRLTEIRAILTTGVQRLLAPAQSDTDEAMRLAASAGKIDASHGGPPSVSTIADSTDPTLSMVDHPSLSAPPVPPHVLAAAARLPTRRPDEQSWAQRLPIEATSGIATNDHDNNRILGEGILTSSTRGPNAGAPGLKRYPEARWGTLNHVEAHVAAMMRADRSLSTVTLTINNQPCNASQAVRDRRTGAIKHDQDGDIVHKQYTCDEQLAAQIPAGAQLSVYVAEGPSQVEKWRTTYVGTGEGIVDP